MMNQLDIILIVIILAGIVIGWRRGLIRMLVSIASIYIIVIVAGYAYKPVGDTLVGGLGRLGIYVGTVGAHNFAYIVVVIALTVAFELASRNSFEATQIRSLGVLDNVLGVLVGIFYGMLWASLFLVPLQYSAATEASPWANAISGSTLAPTLNRVFQSAVLDIVSIFFINGVPALYRNSVSIKVFSLLRPLASSWHLSV
jgi:uncharacterized membrane protein required for colicin V production